MSHPGNRKEPWYSNGLKFSCTQCGKCCKGPNPGHVWVDLKEIEAIAGHLEVPIQAFGQKYLRKIGPRYSLTENMENDCIFWSDDVGCTVYRVRPGQCRQFPFWPELLEGKSDWDREAKSCPGMNNGRPYDLVQIRSITSGAADTRSKPDEFIEAGNN
jgi:uncharacterized protein